MSGAEIGISVLGRSHYDLLRSVVHGVSAVVGHQIVINLAQSTIVSNTAAFHLLL